MAISSSLALISAPTVSQEHEFDQATENRQAELGQYMTPPQISEFMAGQFDSKRISDVKLLDAGAGFGSLSIAFADRWLASADAEHSLSISAYEIDPNLVLPLRTRLSNLESSETSISSEVIEGDFVGHAVSMIKHGNEPFSHAILNPPYMKIRSGSAAHTLMASVEIETVNLYSGFVALALALVRQEGEVVAIIPRSFCNGPYYRSFREFILERSSLKSIHLFEKRDKAFSKDNVLQENIIIRLQKGVPQEDVVISSSSDGSFSDLETNVVPYEEIVFPSDPRKFIHIPSKDSSDALIRHPRYKSTLENIGLSVSTGPIVDFRVKEHLRKKASSEDAPLLYPGHFSERMLNWPRENFKKANAIAINSNTKRWLYPRGFYVVVRRFSSKEEDRRIVASLVDPNRLPETPIGFENHLNVFHQKKGPLEENVARGLIVYLNSDIVDNWMRNFSGHTQVNATDLRYLPYPDLQLLSRFGEWSTNYSKLSQVQIDNKVAGIR
ncbi:Eco57I restriction-modification methylase domain-containing protein [Sphingorhabdus sp. YGSMI21]|uniref:Eco57I restriction-modification methylase domain-containing protein n=1 Tax=Sphingorhabdus sp. YGSMI21 TaxID=2077182 RepID=UPI001980D96A|nr:Eco57I restriction-modification methylase domain-containing protein [Sphingorhabdus sp. YGSMI21]